MSVSNNENESNIIAKGESKFSGKYIVKEVIENYEYYRRLIFLNRGTVIQSEVKLKKGNFFSSIISTLVKYLSRK